MKKKLLPISILGLTFVLTGCQTTNPNPAPPVDDGETINKSTSSLSDTVDLLVDSLYRTEVYNSSEVSFKTTTQIDDSTTQVHEGTMEIYSDEHASETGSDEITYDEVLARGLKVMDLTATCMCKENNLPIIVFDMDTVGNLKKVMSGENIGTLVHN